MIVSPPRRSPYLFRPAIVLAACALLSAYTPPTPPARQWVEIRNVDLRLNDRITIRVRSVHGEVFRTDPNRPAELDDPTSFRINVSAGTVTLTGDDVGALLNSIILAYPGSPLTDVTVRLTGGQLITIGTFHSGGASHRVEMTGTVNATADGRIRLHVLRTHVLGINGEQLLHVLGLHLDNIVNLKGAHGATITGDDILLDPLPFLPPPAITGRLVVVRIDGDRVVQEFATTDEDAAFLRAVPADTSGNFIHFRGGELRFGRLLMQNANLRIDGGHASTPFDLDLPHYTRQLVAGYSRMGADSGLTVYMPNSAAVATAQQ
jgi:hypothetical protein